MTRLRVLAAAICLVLVPPVASGTAAAEIDASDSARAAKLPSRDQWLADVDRVMRRSGAYLRERAATGDTGLAVNFDIDNSSIASHYDGDEAGAIPRILKFARVAQKQGMVLLFNTGRSNLQRERTLTQLAAAGYEVTILCMRRVRETIPHGKQRCRDKFAAKGYTLVANVGNNPTDFTGDGYETAYRLPNYHGQLG